MKEESSDVVRQTRDTYDSIALDYSSKIDRLVSGSWVGEFEKTLLDRLLSMVESVKPLILDIGCGNGKDTDHLTPQVAVAVGIDISYGMLKEATKRVPEGDFCQMDMRHLGFPGDLFDGVWANGCIYHVPKADFVGVLKEIQRILRPSGIFSFNFKIGTGEQLEESPRSYAASPRFYAYYMTHEMKKLLEQTGFSVIEKQRYPERIFDEEIIHVWAKNITTSNSTPNVNKKEN